MSQQIVIFGGTGFVGQEIGRRLSELGYQICLVSRQPQMATKLSSFPATALSAEDRKSLTTALNQSAAVINLAGESLADGRWTKQKQQRIKQSRMTVTSLISEIIADCSTPPPVWIQASAAGYYGASAPGECRESAAPGSDFLGTVCSAWEQSVRVEAARTRVVFMRLGVVLGTTGGALPLISDIYAAGMGSVLGRGDQPFPWIHITDVVRFVEHAMNNGRVRGAYNLAAPEPATNRDWHQALRQTFRCLLPLPAPAPILKMVLGKKSELILKGAKLIPERTLDSGFEFRFANLAAALQDLFLERSYPKLHFIHVRQWVPRSEDEVWNFFSTEKNLEKITPDFLQFKVLGMDTDRIQLNSHIKYKLKLHGLPMRWLTRITEWQPKERFVDFQLKGPYAIWHHQHRFQEFAGGTLIEDLVHFQLPLWPFGNVALPFVRKDVNQIFRYRQKVLFDYLGP